MKFMQCKMPKSGQDMADEQTKEFSEQLTKFLLWIPRVILELSLKEMYKESPCFRMMVKELVSNEN